MIEYIHRLKFKKSRNLQKCLWIYFLFAIYCWVCSLPFRAVFFFTVRLPWRKFNFHLQMVICFFPYSLSFSCPFPLPIWSSIPVSPVKPKIFILFPIYTEIYVSLQSLTLHLTTVVLRIVWITDMHIYANTFHTVLHLSLFVDELMMNFMFSSIHLPC